MYQPNPIQVTQRGPTSPTDLSWMQKLPNPVLSNIDASLARSILMRRDPALGQKMSEYEAKSGPLHPALWYRAAMDVPVGAEVPAANVLGSIAASAAGAAAPIVARQALLAVGGGALRGAMGGVPGVLGGAALGLGGYLAGRHVSSMLDPGSAGISGLVDAAATGVGALGSKVLGKLATGSAARAAGSQKASPKNTYDFVKRLPWEKGPTKRGPQPRDLDFIEPQLQAGKGRPGLGPGPEPLRLGEPVPGLPMGKQTPRGRSTPVYRGGKDLRLPFQDRSEIIYPHTEIDDTELYDQIHRIIREVTPENAPDLARDPNVQITVDRFLRRTLNDPTPPKIDPDAYKKFVRKPRPEFDPATVRQAFKQKFGHTDHPIIDTKVEPLGVKWEGPMAEILDKQMRTRTSMSKEEREAIRNVIRARAASQNQSVEDHLSQFLHPIDPLYTVSKIPNGLKPHQQPWMRGFYRFRIDDQGSQAPQHGQIFIRKGLDSAASTMLHELGHGWFRHLALHSPKDAAVLNQWMSGFPGLVRKYGKAGPPAREAEEAFTYGLQLYAAKHPAPHPELKESWEILRKSERTTGAGKAQVSTIRLPKEIEAIYDRLFKPGKFSVPRPEQISAGEFQKIANQPHPTRVAGHIPVVKTNTLQEVLDRGWEEAKNQAPLRNAGPTGGGTGPLFQQVRVKDYQYAVWRSPGGMEVLIRRKATPAMARNTGVTNHLRMSFPNAPLWR